MRDRVRVLEVELRETARGAFDASSSRMRFQGGDVDPGVELNVKLVIESIGHAAFSGHASHLDAGMAILRCAVHPPVDDQALDHQPTVSTVCHCVEEAAARGDERPLRYRRECLLCGHTWWSGRCPHMEDQRPCPACTVRPRAIPLPVESLKRMLNESDEVVRTRMKELLARDHYREVPPEDR